MSWRDSISIHPAADLFPLLGDAELRELGEDIRRKGLTSPIAIMIERNKPVMVDGRNRLDAMEIIGLRVDLERTGSTWKLLAYESLNGKWVGLALTRTHMLATVVEIKSDPVEYIISVNIHRRHLMAETKRELIAKLLKEHPERSDRATAELVKVDHKTVAAVRRREEDVGSIPHVEKVVDTKGRMQPARKPKPESEPATGTTFAEMGKVCKITKVAQARLDGFFGSVGGIVHGLEALEETLPKAFALIVQEMADKQEAREEVKAARDWLNRLLDLSKAEKRHAAPPPESKTNTATNTVADMPDIPACLDRRPTKAEVA